MTPPIVAPMEGAFPTILALVSVVHVVLLLDVHPASGAAAIVGTTRVRVRAVRGAVFGIKRVSVPVARRPARGMRRPPRSLRWGGSAGSSRRHRSGFGFWSYLTSIWASAVD